jgi:probable phosphoglycerate mutase
MTAYDDEKHSQLHRAQERFRLADGARQIILVRHGASVGPTVETVELDALTISNPQLAPDGLIQAEAVGEALSSASLAAIFVSPLQRTQQTAAPLAQRLGLTAQVVNDLREVHLGDWEHDFYEHAAARHPLVSRMFAEESWEVIPNAESSADFAARVRRGIIAVVEQVDPGCSAAVFSHAGTIAEICHQATDSRPFAFTAPENASISRLIVGSDGSWRLRSFNEVSHL